MKTIKAIKITSILQVLYCNSCIASAIGFALAKYFNLGAFYTIAFFSVAGWALNPTGLASFIICMVFYLKERKIPEAREAIGKKWIWIYAWLIITTLFYAASLLIVWFSFTH